MLLLYRLLFLPALLLALPFYVPRMLRRGGYARHFSQRLGFFKGVGTKPPDVRRVWIHAVSVGEILALAPLLELLRRCPDTQIVLTTTTSTAYDLAERKYGSALAVLGYFPLDFWPVSRHAWNVLRPDLCILMESEIWPEHIFQARKRHVPVFLINARVSERSFRRWRRLSRLFELPFAALDRIVAASDEDMRRFEQLGVPDERIVVSGNLKLDFSPKSLLMPLEVRQLRHELGIEETQSGQETLVLAGASTWPGEEEMLVRVMTSLRERGVFCKLLLIPRHAERRLELREALSKLAVRTHFRTDGPALAHVDVAVGDTTGEMVILLQAADMVYVGKSMDPHQGGQNPIEAAALGKPVMFGPNMQNFRAVAESMKESGMSCTVNKEQELQARVLELFQNEALRQEQGRIARQWHASGMGATKRTFAVLKPYLR